MERKTDKELAVEATIVLSTFSIHPHLPSIPASQPMQHPSHPAPAQSRLRRRSYTQGRKWKTSDAFHPVLYPGTPTTAPRHICCEIFRLPHLLYRR